MSRRKPYTRPFIEIGGEVIYHPRHDMAIPVTVVAVVESDVVVVEYATGQREPVAPAKLSPGKQVATVTRLKQPRKRGRLTVTELVEQLRELGCDEGDEKTQEILRKHGVGR
jgi:hypothetical protein